jgi:hypothetical protein
VSTALRPGKSADVVMTDYGYVLHLGAPGGEETVVRNFRCLQLALRDVFPYGGSEWVVSDILLRMTDTTSFEVWAEPVEPPMEPPSEPPLEPPIEPPPGPLEPPTEPWPEPEPWPKPPTQPPAEPTPH